VSHAVISTSYASLCSITNLPLAFGDAFFKLKNTDYTRQVFGHPFMTPKGRMNMHETNRHLYPHIISPPYLIPTPDISTHTLSDADLFLILASDGLWDTNGVNNGWVVRTIFQGLRAGQIDIAQYLLAQLKEVGRPGDDVSIAILIFCDLG
jgi:serine/threonine protein phosphatase PrpC